jgi:C4-dicarboxylate-specific signal transduction histidine kinase
MPFLPLILGFFKNYWKHILIVIIIGAASYWIYNRIYQRGYAVATAECNIKIADYEAKMTKYKEDLNTRIADIESISVGLVSDLRNSNAALNKDLADIKARAKPRPTYIIKQGTICSPSTDFISSYNEAITRVNK